MNLKPQDVVVLLKLCGYESKDRPPYSIMSADLGMSQSEINASVKRLQSAKLLHSKQMGERPILKSAEEFLIHGVKYAFPAIRGEFTRGMPTSYAAEPLNKIINIGEDPIPVWPDAKGEKRGISLMPLYKTIPAAARRDPVFYERLALLDAIRDGRARERMLAEKELLRSLRQTNG